MTEENVKEELIKIVGKDRTIGEIPLADAIISLIISILPEEKDSHVEGGDGWNEYRAALLTKLGDKK